MADGADCEFWGGSFCSSMVLEISETNSFFFCLSFFAAFAEAFLSLSLFLFFFFCFFLFAFDLSFPPFSSSSLAGAADFFSTSSSSGITSSVFTDDGSEGGDSKSMLKGSVLTLLQGAEEDNDAADDANNSSSSMMAMGANTREPFSLESVMILAFIAAGKTGLDSLILLKIPCFCGSEKIDFIRIGVVPVGFVKENRCVEFIKIVKKKSEGEKKSDLSFQE